MCVGEDWYHLSQLTVTGNPCGWGRGQVRPSKERLLVGCMMSKTGSNTLPQASGGRARNHFIKNRKQAGEREPPEKVLFSPCKHRFMGLFLLVVFGFEHSASLRKSKSSVSLLLNNASTDTLLKTSINFYSSHCFIVQVIYVNVSSLKPIQARRCS